MTTIVKNNQTIVGCDMESEKEENTIVYEETTTEAHKIPEQIEVDKNNERCCEVITPRLIQILCIHCDIFSVIGFIGINFTGNVRKE